MTERNFAAIVIGASAGALDALSQILPELPADFPVPVMIVVHIPPDKESVMAELFRTKCKMQVKEAEDKEPLAAGTIYFAAPDYHLQVEPDNCLSLANDEPVLYSRPSIDVLFETAADAYGDRLIGIILTGANNDGARGLKTVIAAGGLGFVQQPDSAYATAMPHAALEACPDATALTLEQITHTIKRIVNSK